MTSGPIQVLDLRWDGADHLREVKENGVVVFTAAYNGEGLRVSKWDLWTGQHDYTWGPGGVLYDSNGSTTFTPGLAQRSGSSDRLFHSDWLGSTRWMSDGGNGNSCPIYALFDSFGNRHTDVTPPGSFSQFQWAGALVTRRNTSIRACRGSGWSTCSSGITTRRSVGLSAPIRSVMRAG